jgi:hypothetical protein
MRTFACLFLLLLMTTAALAREPVAPTLDEEVTDSTTPRFMTSTHAVGRLTLTVSNYGTFGPAEFPKRSFKNYLSEGGLWVGGVVDGDTLVSTSSGAWGSREFNPDPEPGGGIVYRSSLDPSRSWYEGAISHQDFIAVYTDTCLWCPFTRIDEVDGTPHRPLNVEVTQRSLTWAFDYSQDIVLIDYKIKNISPRRLRYLYIGFYFDGDVFTTLPVSNDLTSNDDLVGFLQKYPADYLPESCPVDSDVVNLGWTADNDGNMTRPQAFVRVEDIIGLSLIGAPRDSLTMSFNWWGGSYRGNWVDYGPQARETYRPTPITWWGGTLGSPRGDRARYHVLRNGERDFDQAMLANVARFDYDWLVPPDELLASIYEYFDPAFLLSIGPFAMDPGQTLSFTVACVAGLRFHWYKYNGSLLPDNPYGWYERVSFTNLARNALWAKWLYDNPGVDTDGDGYAGEFLLCGSDQDSILDTVWRNGDGVPDFRGAFPPPNPSTYYLADGHGDSLPGLRIFPDVGKIRVVWNGAMTENAPDPFTHRNDFEGYRVYIARDERPSSYSIVTSYDMENWSRWVWSYDLRRFVCQPVPSTLQQLRCQYADSCGDTTWIPDWYTKDNPLVIPGSSKNPAHIAYFVRMGENRSILANDPVRANTDVKKVYPHAPRPPVNSVGAIDYPSMSPGDTTYFTEDGFLKYYEYEYTIDNVLPTIVYYVNVTAFDYGYPGMGVLGMEGNAWENARAVYPLPSSEVIAGQGLEVFVYPNPYRLDGNYRELDYEGMYHWSVSEDKTRLIHFANLPPKCTIRIFTLDGDLIRELEHDSDPSDYTSNHATWNLINRSLQLVVSGLYYWSVEDDKGNVQTGKLVIIM